MTDLDHPPPATRTPPLVRAADAALLTGPTVLLRGVLVVRWCVLLWMAVLVLSGYAEFPMPVLGWSALLVAGAWTVGATVVGDRWTTPLLVSDLAVACGLVAVAAGAPRFATVYPVTAVLTWAAVRGLRGGTVAGAVLATALTVGHLAVPARPGGPGAAEIVGVATDAVNFVLAGAGLGFVATLLERSAARLRDAQTAQMRATAHAARLAERESLGRHIHDSVLQVLALVHKRGRELAAAPRPPRDEIQRLADLAATQERSLRTLILRAPADHDRGGAGSLRERLTRAAETVAPAVDVEVTATGASSLSPAAITEIGAAVEQALHNVALHAHTTRAWVFAEMETDAVMVTVRDDGQGFDFDEHALRDAGKFGLLRSIRGRIEQLGGTVRVDTAPGRGTELELRVPRRPAGARP